MLLCLQGGANVVKWSPNGKYLASAGQTDSKVLIWDINKRETIDHRKHHQSVLALSWNPSANSLAMVI